MPVRSPLNEAIDRYRKNPGVVRVEHPEVGQRVIVMVREERGPYIPSLATIVGINNMSFTALLYCTGSKKKTVFADNIFTKIGDDWCSSKHGDPFPFAFLGGREGESWIGCVYVDRQPYERNYPEIDFDTGTLTSAQVLADWKAAPDSFILKPSSL